MAVTLNANSSTGFIATSDTSSILQLQTGGTTAVTVSAAQVVTLANPLPVASGGSGGTTSTGTGANVLGTTPSFTSTIGVGGATASASGAGITFPATQSASTDANTLDDYEEGAWTPTITDGTVSKTGSGNYTKIGNMVWVRAVVNDVESGGGLTGTVYMTGLPFTPAARVSLASFINYTTGATSWSAMTATAATQVRFYQMNANGVDDVQITGADTNFYTDFYVGGTYTV
jgi:hypothetical protein